MSFSVIRRLMVAALALLVGVSQASSTVAKEPAVLLSVHLPGKSEPLELTDTDLMALEQVSFSTSTLWTAEPHVFSGPSLQDVLKLAGVQQPVVIDLIAANDYSATLTPDLMDQSYPIIANRINGEPFGVRDKGPLWIMYPFDADDGYRREIKYSVSVWQLTDIAIRDAETASATDG